MSDQTSSANDQAPTPAPTLAEPRGSDAAQSWTAGVQQHKLTDEQVFQYMASSFNRSPFMSHNHVNMCFKDGRFYCEVDMQPSVIGNSSYGILHGGVSATLIDSVGGIEAMAAIYNQTDEPLEERMKKIGRLATIDMRIDYLAPGRGNRFTATARVLRLGRKTCTTQMEVVNDEGKLIAVGTATYGF